MSRRPGKTCLIDSNGILDFRQYPELLQLCDGVMLDMKAIDDDFHRQLTGASNRPVLDNLTMLLEAGKLGEVRTVLLPEFSEQNQKTVRGVNERRRGKSATNCCATGPLGYARKDCDSAAGRSRRWKKPSVWRRRKVTAVFIIVSSFEQNSAVLCRIDERKSVRASFLSAALFIKRALA